MYLFDVKSAVNLVAVPTEDVRPGRELPLQATLTDDTGAGIPGMVLRNSQGAEAVTDGQGIALLTLTVPDMEEPGVVPVTFTFEGDELHLPLKYFLAVPVTPAKFNWLLWVGLPLLLAAVVAAGYGARRWRPSGLLTQVPARFRGSMVRREPVGGPIPQVTAIPEEPEPEPEPVPEPEPTMLAISLGGRRPDLPAVWGVGEQVAISLTLSVEGGPGVDGATIEGTGPDGLWTLETDEQGHCAFDWTGDALGEFMVSASFPGNDLYLESSHSSSFRVVDFREEIVRLYNSFVEWAGEQTPSAANRTPRELESMLVTSGLSLDHRAIDEVISRFEEADYSEHPIGRHQYEAMYRNWHTIVGE